MKTRSTMLLAAVAMLAGTLATYGDTNYWDNNGAAEGFGTAAGTWGVDPNWSADSSGASEPTITATTATDDLHVGTSSNGLATGTITVDGANQAFRSLTFGAACGAITLSGGSFDLAVPTSEIYVNNVSNTIASVLAGTNGLYKYSDSLIYPGFLTGSTLLLISNATLSACVDITGTMSGTSISGNNTPAIPYYFTNDGTNATVQMQAINGSYTKCVRVKLTQSGPHIYGYATYAKYTAPNQLGFDFDKGGTGVGIATSPTTGAYGIQQIVLTTDQTLVLTGSNTYSGATAISGGILTIGGTGWLGNGSYGGAITNNGQLRFSSASDQYLRGTISGTGSLVMDTPSKREASVTVTNFLPTTATVIIPHASIADCVSADGVMGGFSINGGTGPVAANAYFFTNTGQIVTYQMQTVEGGATKCVKVELTQVGTGIAARGRYAKYVLGSQLGFDFDPITSNTLFVATSFSANNYGVAETTLTLLAKPRLILSGANAYTGGTVVNGGVLEATTTNAALPSAGGITINNGGELILGVDGVSNGAGGVGNLNPIMVNNGSTLTLGAKFAMGGSRAVVLDGSTLNSTVTEAGDAANYVNDLTLKNNARVIGYKVRMGEVSGTTPVITVSGTSASTLEAGINLAKITSSPLTINVADVTGNPEPDLVIPGVIQDYALPHLTGMPIIKTGAGTLSLSGVNTHTGRITITSGTLALRTNNTLNAFCSIVLNGGALDMGSYSNALEKLTVATNSVIVLGTGKLAFADSSAMAWLSSTNTLMLTGVLGPQTVRFGTNDTALTFDQLTAIKFDGGRIRLKSDGYLAPGLKGTLIRLQ